MPNELASHEAEKTVLGLCFHNPQTAGEATSQLCPDDFSLSAHRSIFCAISTLVADGTHVDELTLAQQLGKELEAVGGYSFLSSLTEGVVRRAIDPQIAVLKGASRRRQIRNACELAMLACEQGSETTDECLTLISDALLKIESNNSKQLPASLADAMPVVIQELQTQSKQEGLVGMTTGVAGLDWATTGIRPGELWVVGALPGRGKTALGAQILLANGSDKVPSLAFSLEMTKSEIAKRLLAAKCLSAGKLRNPRYISADGWRDLLESAAEMSTLPIWIDDSPSLTVQEIVSRARLFIRKHGVRLVVVDYLRLVQSSGRDLRERVGNTADALRTLAKTEQVGVVLLSQLRRPEGGINSRPSMIELKESGDIEAHAHVVLLLYMPVGDDGKPVGEDEIIIGKQRHGPIGSHPVRFSETTLQFQDRSA